MTVWSDVWNALRSHIGFVEGSGNRNPWTEAMRFGDCAYCSAFQTVCPHQEAGVNWPGYVQVPPVGEAYSPNWSRFPSWAFDHASRGQPVDLLPGDIVTYDWGGDGTADHTECVVQVYADGSFDTIGANTGSPEGVHCPIRRDRRYLVGRYRPSAAGVWSGGGPVPGPAPAPPPGPVGQRVLRQGMTGGDVATWQDQLNHVGGYGLATDGDFGPATNNATRDFQGKHGCTVDGQVGPQSRAAMAAALAQPGPAPAPPPPAPAPAPPAPGHAPDGNPFTPLIVDGDFGPNTTKALQWKCGAPADGSFGPQSKAALQRHLGVGADGVIGPVTVRALQARVGAVQDGVWGPQTTAALQRALNAGAF